MRFLADGGSLEVGAMQQSFSGHETFPFRYPWLKKGFDAVLADGNVFRRDDAMTTLGVGKNMVRSIRHWSLAAGVVEEVPAPSGRPSGHLRATGFGKALLGDDGWDPYLEDPASLWLLHWRIASNAHRCTTWYWAFNHYHEPTFTRETLLAALLSWLQGGKATRASESSLRRDVECFLRTYLPSRRSKSMGVEETLDCPLTELSLLRVVGEEQVLQFQRGPQPQLPDGVLFFAIVGFWDKTAPGTSSLSLQDLARRPGSPGQLFKIEEPVLAERCDNVERWTDGALSYSDTAGSRQLYRRGELEAVAFLNKTYAPSTARCAERR
jgi:hypothetical protein